MDRSRALKLGLIAAALIVCAAADSATPLLLREQAWTAPGETLARDLTHAQGECLVAVNQRALPAEIGRALFRSPYVLGGPAARAGLSCHACHTNGRVNTRFLLSELTNIPAHADVTSEWASARRGDGVVNPIPIPDLVGAATRTGFGQAREPLETFVRGVVEDEFQGAALPDQALNALVTYILSLEHNACATTEVGITLATAADDVRRALAAAENADAETAPHLVLAAQDAMGRIVERLPEARFARERARLETLARDLGALRQHDVHAALAAGAPGWRARFDAEIARIGRRERETYFNEATLAAALAQGR